MVDHTRMGKAEQQGSISRRTDKAMASATARAIGPNAPRLHTALNERYKAFSTDQVLQMLRLYEQIKDWIVEFEMDLVDCISIGGCGADITLPRQISVDAWEGLWEDKQKALLDKLRLHFGFHVMLTVTQNGTREALSMRLYARDAL